MSIDNRRKIIYPRVFSVFIGHKDTRTRSSPIVWLTKKPKTNPGNEKRIPSKVSKNYTIGLKLQSILDPRCQANRLGDRKHLKPL